LPLAEGICGLADRYPLPDCLPKLQAYAPLGQTTEDLFVNRSDAHLLSLPIGEHMTTTDANEVVQAIRDFFE